MSEVRVNLLEPEAGTCSDQGGPSPDPVNSPSIESSGPDLQG